MFSNNLPSANAAKYELLRKYHALFDAGVISKKYCFGINRDDGKAARDRVAFAGQINLVAD